MFSPFLDEELADENVPRKAGDAVAELPYWGRVDGAELVRDFLNDVIEERLVDVADGGVISPHASTERRCFFARCSLKRVM